MLRFIVRHKWRDAHSGAEGEYLRTIDADVPELHDDLTVGGYGPSGYDQAELIGVAVLPAKKEPA